MTVRSYSITSIFAIAAAFVCSIDSHADDVAPAPTAVPFTANDIVIDDGWVETEAATVAQTAPPDPFASKLLGNLWGTRNCAADCGITTDVMFTQFYQGVAAGGLTDQFRYGAKGDYYVNVDGEKAGLWKGLFVQLHGESRLGNDVNTFTGALSTSNTAMLFPLPNQELTALTGVKITQALSENFVVYFGKLNLLDAYTNPFAAGRGIDQFMNLSLVLPPVFARTVPYSPLGAGFAILAKGQPVLSVNVFDADTPTTQSGFNTLFAKGATIFTQATLPVSIANRPGHQTLYGVYSSRSYTSLDPTNWGNPIPQPFVIPKTTGSWALHYSMDQYLYVDPQDPTKGWGMFAQASISDGNPNPIRWFANAGIGGNSPIQCRSADRFGVGYYFIGISDQLKSLVGNAVPLRDDQGFEFYYNIAAFRGCYITPDIQVCDPFRVNSDTSLVLGVRAKLDF